ncbi:MAG: hypothetical protein HC880_11360 [Bacteroidia bacterium]|nr:hypothetical protein [Bacteroidia bacterium]
MAEIPEIEIEEDLPDFPGPPTPSPQERIEQLLSHEQTFHLGALVRSLWAGLSIPLHSPLPNQQPLGGFSDISNKGSLNRLLISEFAYDDLSFLSRLANQEALYINREMPPQSDNRERIILIDVSIKTGARLEALPMPCCWPSRGTPKVKFPAPPLPLARIIIPWLLGIYTR